MAWALESVCSQIIKCEGSRLRGGDTSGWGSGQRPALDSPQSRKPPQLHRWLATSEAIKLGAAQGLDTAPGRTPPRVLPCRGGQDGTVEVKSARRDSEGAPFLPSQRPLSQCPYTARWSLRAPLRHPDPHLPTQPL